MKQQIGNPKLIFLFIISYDKALQIDPNNVEVLTNKG